MKLKKFTLLELLLVIAIILILLSLIIPMVIKAQRSAELVVCVNNLKSISMASALYHKDNKRYFPDAIGSDYVTKDDTGHLDKYLDNNAQVIVCPMNPAEDESYIASAKKNASFTSDLDGDLEYNAGDATATPKRRSLKVSKVLRPAAMSLMVSTEVYDDGSVTNYWHDLSSPRYPFLSVSGSVKNLYFYGGMGNNGRPDTFDIKNE